MNQSQKVSLLIGCVLASLAMSASAAVAMVGDSGIVGHLLQYAMAEGSLVFAMAFTFASVVLAVLRQSIFAAALGVAACMEMSGHGLAVQAVYSATIPVAV